MTVWTVPATILRVIDADSVYAELDLGFAIYHRATIRVEGVDSPELRTERGKLAATWARSLLPPGTNVTVQSCRWEKYGRILGRIHLATGDDYATALLAAGYAQPYDGHGPR